MYKPREIIFAPTSRCNLACAHCRVSRIPNELGIEEALVFLRQAVALGIDRVGFSGGEPFLRPDFLAAIIEESLGLGLLFDRLMTNGLWFADLPGLKAGLRQVFEAGFDGRVGLSFDSWHGQDPEQAALFLATLFEISGRRDSAELVVVADKDGEFPIADLEALAGRLEARLLMEGKIPRAIEALKKPSTGERATEPPADGETLSLPVLGLPYSAAGAPDSKGAWESETWFVDDFCEGPGQVLYVHPDGSVAVCCGFANERDELKLGFITEGVEGLLERAKDMPAVKTCYESGLGGFRKSLESSGMAFPGKTRDQCFFCDYLCGKGLFRP